MSYIVALEVDEQPLHSDAREGYSPPFALNSSGPGQRWPPDGRCASRVRAARSSPVAISCFRVFSKITRALLRTFEVLSHLGGHGF